MLPLLDEAEENDAVDGWHEPSDTLTGGQLLSKYDDVEELAMKKKKAGRLTIGNGSAPLAEASAKKSRQRADLANGESFLTKRTVGSDYYAANEEDPLAGLSKSFKKTKNTGTKRTRMSAMTLVDNEAAENDEEEDIVSALEASARNNGLNHLATKKARQDATKAAEVTEAVQASEKRANFQRAFDRVKLRNQQKNGGGKESRDDLFDMTADQESSAVQDDDYALIEH